MENRQVTQATMASGRIVLISGCSSGIGLYTALLLAKDPQRRFKVYATMRNLEKKATLENKGKDFLGETLIVKQMDVSSDVSVSNAVDELISKEGKIDVLSKYGLRIKRFRGVEEQREILCSRTPCYSN